MGYLQEISVKQGSGNFSILTRNLGVQPRPSTEPQAWMEFEMHKISNLHLNSLKDTSA